MPRDWRSDDEKRRDQATAWRFKLEATLLAVAIALSGIAALANGMR